MLKDFLKDKNRETRHLESEVRHNHYHLHNLEEKVDIILDLMENMCGDMKIAQIKFTELKNPKEVNNG